MFPQAKKMYIDLADVSSISKPLVALLEPVRFLYDWISCGELRQLYAARLESLPSLSILAI
jgi:hypothetical protein